MTPADDRDLIERAARGDGEAFGELINRHQSGVFNVAYRMLGDRRDAEDAAQETFLRALRSFHSYNRDLPLAPWLKRIAFNVSLNRIKNDKEILLQESRPVPDQNPGPERQLLEKEFHQQIRYALLSLPPRFRAAIELRHFQDLSYAEMAAALHRPLSDVKSDLFRARRMLAERLEYLRQE